jgi:hypothetical protein
LIHIGSVEELERVLAVLTVALRSFPVDYRAWQCEGVLGDCCLYRIVADEFKTDEKRPLCTEK